MQGKVDSLKIFLEQAESVEKGAESHPADSTLRKKKVKS
jgi:hypothetical protein